MAISPVLIGSIDNPLTWEEFEIEIEGLRDTLSAAQAGAPYAYFGHWLFRGQSDASWELKTSLERYLEKLGRIDISDVRYSDYFERLVATIPAINSLAGKKFNRDIKEGDGPYPWDLEALELLYYLRHHGFPTPTLDWSRSYFVSAFFAFQYATVEKPVAIYAFNENLHTVRSRSMSDPYINTLGSYVETHRRHFLQQSEYTYCTAERDDVVYFARHDDALAINPHSHPCMKFILAGSEREKVLKKLDEANINAYTLYGNEEGLMDMLAFRELRF